MTHPPAEPDGPTPVLIPAPAEHAAKSWAKTIRAVTPDLAGDARSKGAALVGDWLDRAATYALYPGTLIATCDKAIDGTATVALYQVTADPDTPLSELKTWTSKKGVIGTQILTCISSRLARTNPPRQAPHLLTPAPPRANTRTEECQRCRQEVPAGTGVLVRIDGRSRAQHSPSCPPLPPQRNIYPQECLRCRQLVPANEGILIPPPDTNSPWQVRHEGDCPPASTSASTAASTPVSTPVSTSVAAVRRNRKPGTCAECLQDVPAGEGELRGGPGYWSVTCLDACPPHPLNPAGEPTWRIASGDNPRVASVVAGPAAGEVARVHVLIGHDQQPPTDTIGYRALDTYPAGLMVSFIAMGLASWSRREQDIDDEEWYDAHDSIVRAATAEEAAPVLAAEAKRARRAALARRVEDLLTVNRYKPAPDHYWPSPEELQDVSFGAGVPIPISVAGRTYPTTVHVDEETGHVWTWMHNGHDGDDWSANNLGGGIAVRHPLTPDRAALIADLYAEYDNPVALADEVGAAEDEVAALLAAGWSGHQVRESTKLFRLSQPGDGAALTARTPAQWREVGWWQPLWLYERFAPGDAARLADAGIPPSKACALGGSVEKILACAPPTIPAEATRILVLPPQGQRGGSGQWALAAMDAGQMAAYLANCPERWSWELKAETGPHPRHVTSDWQVWDDNAVTITYWVHRRPSHIEEHGNVMKVVHHDDPAWPRAFTDGGERLIGLLLKAGNAREVFGSDKPHWLQVATDASLSAPAKVDETRHDRYRAGCGATLYVHSIARPGQTDEQLWQVDVDHWYRGEDADVEVTYCLYRSERDARDAYREAVRTLG